jgi:hypothetical protein
MIARLMSGPGTASAPATSALRGGMNGPLIFESEDVVVTLDIQPGLKGQASVQGQVAADDQDQWTGATVRMFEDGMPEATALLDDLGAFRFEGVRSGSIQLKIVSPGGIEVQISSVDISI